MKYKTTISTIILATTAGTAYWAFAQAQSSTEEKPKEVNVHQVQSVTATQLLKQEQARNQLATLYVSEISKGSLKGSQPDGAVNLDASGQVMADKSLHRLFDYYLSAQGEMTIDEIKIRLLKSSSDFLSLDQLEQVRDLFDQYVDYLEKSEQFAVSMLSDLPLREQLHAIEEYRERILGKDIADAFFAEEHAYAKWVMGDLKQENFITSQQHKWLLQENAATAFQDEWLHTQQQENISKSNQYLIEKRTERYGSEAAMRLAQLDLQQENWHKTVDVYIDLRVAAQGDVAAVKLIDESYDSQTLKRLHAYYQQHLNQG